MVGTVHQVPSDVPEANPGIRDTTASYPCAVDNWAMGYGLWAMGYGLYERIGNEDLVDTADSLTWTKTLRQCG